MFGSAGFADKDTSPFEFTANLGIAVSSPIPTRERYTFGIARYYNAVSDDLRATLRPVVKLRDGSGVEFFYNLAVTPWLHLTQDFQIINPGVKSANTAFMFGLRGGVTRISV